MIKKINLQAVEASPALYVVKSFHIEDAQSIAVKVDAPPTFWLHYFVYDSNGKLRMQYLHKNTPQPVILHHELERSAPYTFGGPLPSGEWTIKIFVAKQGGFNAKQEIGTVEIITDYEGINYHDTIWYAADEDQLQPTNMPFSDEQKWLKGDFHTHTIYSDGELTREENMMMAQQQQLDFFVATDHNLVPSSWCTHVTDTLVIPGIEVTASKGHFNILGVAQSPFSHFSIETLDEEEVMNAIIEQVKTPALVSINHPFLTIWSWLFEQTQLSSIDSIEIINDPTYADNTEASEKALLAWNILLNDGYHITGIGGSDSHLHPSKMYPNATTPSLIGDPATYVYAAKNTAAILKSVREGLVYVSRIGRLQLQLDTFIMGETVPMKEGEMKLHLLDDKATIEWVMDGQVVKRHTGFSDAYKFILDGNYHWIRIDLRNEKGELVGFTNPYYFGEKPTTLKNWGEIIKQLEVLHD